jgi:dTDP-4-dehydrorhamnose reductase
MRVVVTGANGQLGQALQRVLAPLHEIVALGHADLELANPDSTMRLMDLRPDLVIHPAAMTNVDGCAREPDLAYRINGLGTRYVALACQALDIPLVYISTNEVFDGAASVPYREYDRPAPVNPYGYSKWVGEQAVRELVRHAYIVRVAWLFGGVRNFVRTVLRLAQERETLTMVSDEIGSPTYAPDVAEGIARLIGTGCYGTYHFVNEGICSRFDLAAATLRLAGQRHVALLPMRLADYKRPGAVPPYTPLANIAAADLGIRLQPWQAALEEFLRS